LQIAKFFITTVDLISDLWEKGETIVFLRLVSESKLILKSYILSEYVHKYYIQNTNTDPVVDIEQLLQ
jgi:hypothetical protein